MRIRRKNWTNEILEEQKNALLLEENYFLSNFPFIFDLDKEKIVLEIGCGKGDFILNMAKSNENTNFIGIEQSRIVTSIALRKLSDEKIENVKIVNMNANKFNELKKGKIDIIRLNFSDPWPRKKHEKRRLTSKIFLQIYKKLLKEDGKIIFKTDNKPLFDFSVESFKENGYKLLNVNYDYSLTISQNDYPTEYEKKFRDNGDSIYYLEAVLEK